MKHLPARILEGVASIQTGTLKTEVEKDFMRTVIGHGLADPKGQGSPAHADIVSSLERESG